MIVNLIQLVLGHSLGPPALILSAIPGFGVWLVFKMCGRRTSPSRSWRFAARLTELLPLVTVLWLLFRSVVNCRSFVALLQSGNAISDEQRRFFINLEVNSSIGNVLLGIVLAAGLFLLHHRLRRLPSRQSGPYPETAANAHPVAHAKGEPDKTLCAGVRAYVRSRA